MYILLIMLSPKSRTGKVKTSQYILYITHDKEQCITLAVILLPLFVIWEVFLLYIYFHQVSVVASLVFIEVPRSF